jgi:hypothetical protein
VTIQDRCRSTNGLLDVLERGRQEQSLADALNKRADELREFQEPFVAAAASLQTLRERGIVSESHIPDGSKVAERLASMRQQLVTEPQDVTKGQAFTLLCKAIGKLTEQCEELAAESWKEHVTQVAPVVDRTVIDQYGGSPQHADVVYQIEVIVRDLKPLVKKPPPDAETLHAIEHQWEELRSRLRTLPITEDPEVQAFLNAAISGDGAALDLLTKTVRRWLEENQMLTDFCIRRSK